MKTLIMRLLLLAGPARADDARVVTDRAPILTLATAPDGTLYWFEKAGRHDAHPRPPGIYALAPTAGAKPVLFFEDQASDRATLAVDATAVYLASEDSLRRFPRDGSPPATLVTESISGFAASADTLVWVGPTINDGKTGRKMFALPKRGVARPTLLTEDAGDTQRMLVVGASVYFENGHTHTISRVPLAGGKMQPVAKLRAYLANWTVDGSGVPIYDQPGEAHAILHGSTVIVRHRDQELEAAAVASDGTIYLADQAGVVTATGRQITSRAVGVPRWILVRPHDLVVGGSEGFVVVAR